MAIKTFTTGEVLTAADTNTYLANAGLVFVKSQTVGNAVSSVTVASAFSATYDQYLITLSGGTGTGNDGLLLQLGSVVSGYKWGFTYSSYAAGPSFVGSSGAIGFSYTGANSSTSATALIFLQNPFLSNHTSVQSSAQATSFGGTTVGILPTTDSFTAFTLSTLAGTLTGGIITVYGYRKG